MATAAAIPAKNKRPTIATTISLLWKRLKMVPSESFFLTAKISGLGLGGFSTSNAAGKSNTALLGGANAAVKSNTVLFVGGPRGCFSAENAALLDACG